MVSVVTHWGYANNKGTDQPAHPHSLTSTFLTRLLESIISKLDSSEISIFYLVYEAFGWSESPKTGFLATTQNVSLLVSMAAVCSKVVIMLLLQNVVQCLLLLPLYGGLCLVLALWYRVKSGYFGHQVNSDTHLQTVEIKMRRPLMSRLIRIFTVCLVKLTFIQIIKI